MNIIRFIALIGLIALSLVQIIRTVSYVISENLVYKLGHDFWWTLVPLWLTTAVVIILIIMGRTKADEKGIISTHDLLIGAVLVWIFFMLDMVRMIR